MGSKMVLIREKMPEDVEAIRIVDEQPSASWLRPAQSTSCVRAAPVCSPRSPLGHPEYYPRFDFERASRYDIW